MRKSARQNQAHRGFALMMVLLAIATLSVMTYALCAAARMRSQIASSAAIRVQGEHLAESGLNVAAYYLQNPKASPVLVYGDSGNVHYPGESPLAITGLPGIVNVTVGNPANGTFTITSTATYQGHVTTATATLKVEKSKTFAHGAVLTGSPVLNGNVSLLGGAITNGALLGPIGAISNNVVATNGSALGGVAATTETPDSYPVSMPQRLPTYFYEGKTCTATIVSTDPLVLPLINDNPGENPANVFFINKDIRVLLPQTINGTLAIKAGNKITLSSNLTVTAMPGMPALVAVGDIVFNSNAATTRTLQSNGVTYIGGRIQGSGSSATSKCKFLVNGVLLAPKGGWPFESSYGGQVTSTYDPNRATVTAFADEIEDIDKLRVQSWEILNGRPQ